MYIGCCTSRFDTIMDKSFLHIKVISLYLLISAVCRISYSCSGFPAPGRKLYFAFFLRSSYFTFISVIDTYPIGDILIEYNTSTPLQISCIITNDSWIAAYPNISSQLRFMKDKSNVPQDKVFIF